MAGWPSRTPSLPIVARALPGPARVLVPEIVVPARPVLPIRPDGRRSLRTPDGSRAYRRASHPWIGVLVDTYG
jgi:hypothetical protein